MPFNIFNDSTAGATFILCIVTAPLCITITALRFFMTKRAGRPIGLEDWFALVALFFFLVWVVYSLALTIIENGQEVLTGKSDVPPSTIVAIIQAGYVVQPLYGVNQLAAKMSLLTLYHRIWFVRRKFVYLVYGVGCLQIMWFLAWFFGAWFQCTPPAKIWNPFLPGTCIHFPILLAASESVNSAIDFVMVGMAISMVWNIQTALVNKLKLYLLFIFGGLSGVFGIIKIAMAYGTISKSNSILVWYLLQMATSIICCCLPVYRPIFTDLLSLRALGSRLWSTIRSKSRSTRSSGGGHGELERGHDLDSLDEGLAGYKKKPGNDQWARDGSSTQLTGTEDGSYDGRILPGTAYATKTVEILQNVGNQSRAVTTTVQR